MISWDGSNAGMDGSELVSAKISSWIRFVQLAKLEFAAILDEDVLDGVSLSDIWNKSVRKAAPTWFPDVLPICDINGFAEAATVGPVG